MVWDAMSTNYPLDDGEVRAFCDGVRWRKEQSVVLSEFGGGDQASGYQSRGSSFGFEETSSPTSLASRLLVSH